MKALLAEDREAEGFPVSGTGAGACVDYLRFNAMMYWGKGPETVCL
ncbi:MAG: hypothetical protein K2P59_03940 [Acetatifactor sp.]|nr:hypothetical protein [Acetatifactor sp.]